MVFCTECLDDRKTKSSLLFYAVPSVENVQLSSDRNENWVTQTGNISLGGKGQEGFASHTFLTEGNIALQYSSKCGIWTPDLNKTPQSMPLDLLVWLFFPLNKNETDAIAQGLIT